MDIKWENIGAHIRSMRRQRGMKAQELAKAVGLTTKSLSQIENGKSEPRKANLIGIAKALNCTIAELRGITPPAVETNLENKEGFSFNDLKGLFDDLKTNLQRVPDELVSAWFGAPPELQTAALLVLTLDTSLLDRLDSVEDRELARTFLRAARTSIQKKPRKKTEKKTS